MKSLVSLFVLAFAGAFAFSPSAAIAQQAPTVMIDGSPMTFNDQPPIERSGRIYVPMRAIFERLGAMVVYDAGTINATRGGRRIQLEIGQPAATVAGQQVQLDAPPFEIAGRTLVPLRFVSQALGARVSWNESNMTAYITTEGGMSAMPPMRTGTPPYHPGTSHQQSGPAWADQGHAILHRPFPWGSVSQQYPLINASFRRPMRRDSIVVRLDGRNVTDIAKVTTMGFEFTPAYRLRDGTHTVSVMGVAQDGAQISDGWTFTVSP
jgi:hypothetical protein